MKKYVLEVTLQNGKKKYGSLYDTKEEAERDRRGWLKICGGKAPFKMEVLDLKRTERNEQP